MLETLKQWVQVLWPVFNASLHKELRKSKVQIGRQLWRIVIFELRVIESHVPIGVSGNTCDLSRCSVVPGASPLLERKQIESKEDIVSLIILIVSSGKSDRNKFFVIAWLLITSLYWSVAGRGSSIVKGGCSDSLRRGRSLRLPKTTFSSFGIDLQLVSWDKKDNLEYKRWNSNISLFNTKCWRSSVDFERIYRSNRIRWKRNAIRRTIG